MKKRNSLGWNFIRGFTWAGLAFLVLPTLIAVPVSLTPKRYLSMPTGEISMRHYTNLFSSAEWMSSIGQSDHSTYHFRNGLLSNLGKTRTA